MSANGVHRPDVAIVGAGVSGLAMAIKLTEAGIPFTIFEKAREIGGTWRDNTYPGLTCDVPAAVYTYSFGRNPHWPRWLATGDEIQRYVEAVCEKHGVREHTRFATEVVEARWLDEHWQLRTAQGDEYRFDVVIHATGFLHRPRYPDIPGLETFAGAAFHSARWDHGVEFAGRRVGVIGTGSTGVQIVTALAGTAEHVAMFQRTAQWIFPMGNPRIPKPMRRALARWPGLSERWVQVLVRAIGDWFLSPAATRPGLQRRVFGWACRRSLRTVRDPELRARLTPTYQPLCKRPVMSTKFYKAIQRPDLELVETGIDHICPEGVVTSDGRLHELDVLALATGFDAHAYMRPMRVVGEQGVTLEQAWQDGPHAYLTVAVPGFPNMFTLMGPHSPLINVPVHESVELQADYILRVLELLGRPDITSAAPTADAAERWLADIRAGMAPTVWASGCQSWYIGPDGVAVQWPFTRKRLRTLLRAPDLGDYAIRAATPEPQYEREPATGEARGIR
jgi:cation diffusion facilitator CzcD-associated flavoprotein CzcO